MYECVYALTCLYVCIYLPTYLPTHLCLNDIVHDEIYLSTDAPVDGITDLDPDGLCEICGTLRVANS